MTITFFIITLDPAPKLGYIHILGQKCIKILTYEVISRRIIIKFLKISKKRAVLFDVLTGSAGII
jgi:hypothetical protein